MNPVNHRLGRYRGNYTKRANDKHARQVANRILTECEEGERPLWHKPFAESILKDGVIEHEH